MFHFKPNFLNRGQTLLEGVVALAAIVVVLTAISIATITNLSNSQFIKNQSLASKYGQQAMETIRYTRNNDPTTFFTVWTSAINPNRTYCMNSAGTMTDAGAACGQVDDFSGSKFIREVKFNATSPRCSNGTLATITVYWNSGKCDPTSLPSRYCHKTQIVSCFADPSISGKTL